MHRHRRRDGPHRDGSGHHHHVPPRINRRRPLHPPPRGVPREPGIPLPDDPPAGPPPPLPPPFHPPLHLPIPEFPAPPLPLLLRPPPDLLLPPPRPRPPPQLRPHLPPPPPPPPSLPRVLYLDSDLLLVDDVSLLFSLPLHPHVLAAPEYCHANFSSYFTHAFWLHHIHNTNTTNNNNFNHYFRQQQRQRQRRPCYFNTGVMVIDLIKWREGGYTRKLEGWMRMQKRVRIYELGSLPPFLLVFGGDVKGVEHRWNQHGLGGDNVEGLCRDLHPGPVSLLHWSGKGKPWLRLDAGSPCPLDRLWAPYDLLRRDGDDRVLVLSDT
ncbi:hypothetical protein Syun_021546 [Stephania yunnanensis]|uniref:Hexosyltransferase n=1 Tax=Stephania yunnanensis TaxID=152371 RepID=A0AAP0IFT1_9MAGN